MAQQHTTRLMTESDVTAADQLRAAAGWNQLPSDWLRLLRSQPPGCFVAEQQSGLVGTVTTTLYGKRLAWIGMMLVHPDVQRQGIATSLMNQALEFLKNNHIPCIKLDATPTGQFVYERLGFQAEWCFHRWHRPGTNERLSEFPTNGGGVIPSDLCDMDEIAFGADRRHWLERVAADSTVVIHQHGFGMRRPGQRASYLGPITAQNDRVAEEIVTALLDGISGDVFWDIPAPNTLAVEIARRIGFKPVRNLTRMWTGSTPLTPDYRLQFGLTDPGTG